MLSWPLFVCSAHAKKNTRNAKIAVRPAIFRPKIDPLSATTSVVIWFPSDVGLDALSFLKRALTPIRSQSKRATSIAGPHVWPLQRNTRRFRKRGSHEPCAVTPGPRHAAKSVPARGSAHSKAQWCGPMNSCVLPQPNKHL